VIIDRFGDALVVQVNTAGMELLTPVLLEALEARRIMGAALDVQVDEPPKPDDPLLKCDRLILTPHSATATSETYIRSAKTVAQNVLDMFDGRLPSFANTRSMRVAGGLGTVARVVGDAQEIYDQRISVAEALQRIDGLYKPYHRALRRVFMRLHRDFGAAVLIDCHSMPSSAGAKDERPRADVVLGDRYGTSCVAAVAETIESTLRAQGYSVSRNKPYAGGFITEHYGNPAAGLHAIQLELNRALYMDERRFERSPSFVRLAADLETLAECLAAIPIQELRPYRAAAE